MTAKPYRLINSTELIMLQQQFEHALSQWNEQYAQHSVRCTLKKQPEQVSAFALIMEAQRPIALITTPYEALIKAAVFNDLAACFDDISHTLFIELLISLFNNKTVDCIGPHTSFGDSTWFYRGSPTLLLTLHVAQHSLPLLLHPQWVFEQLKAQARIASRPSLIPLQDALNSQPITLAVQLKPLRLSIEALTQLQVGHVIKTDHKISERLPLMQGKEVIADAALGATSFYKSIQLTRTS